MNNHSGRASELDFGAKAKAKAVSRFQSKQERGRNDSAVSVRLTNFTVFYTNLICYAIMLRSAKLGYLGRINEYTDSSTTTDCESMA